MITRHVLVSGRVQGVGFRAFVARQAQAIGLDGWVRNRSDGSVELVACGSAEAVALLIDACRQGPLGSHVTSVEIYEAQSSALAARDSGKGFLVIGTA